MNPLALALKLKPQIPDIINKNKNKLSTKCQIFRHTNMYYNLVHQLLTFSKNMNQRSAHLDQMSLFYSTNEGLFNF